MIRVGHLIRRYLDRARMSPLARRVKDQGLTYLSPAKFRRIERAMQSTKNVAGDFAEFGVALGGSAIVIASQSQDRCFHGFDVFGMIPEPTSDKDDEKSKARYETIKSGGSKGLAGQTYYGYRSDLYSEVVARFAEHGVPVSDRIALHKGLFEDAIPRANLDRIAFAHIDCDWYDPVKLCLTSLAPKVSPGGLMIIDDYYDYGGCRTAVDEFLLEHSEFCFEDGPNPILRRL